MSPQTQTTNAAFPLGDEERVWLVRTGAVDVFLELRAEAERDGPRRHLFRVEEGEALFGMTPAGDHCAVLALPVRGAQLEVQPLEAAAADQLETWVERVTGAIAAHAPPKRFEPLSEGCETALDNRPVSPRSGLLWVRIAEGEARFLGDESLPSLAAGDCLPLSAKAWLEPVGAARFTASALPESLAGLSLFHRIALIRLHAIAAQEEAEERALARRRAQVDLARMDSSLRSIAAPLNPALRGSGAAAGNPWLAACRAIGPLIGVEFAAPPARAAAASSGHPLEAIADLSRTRYRSVLLTAEWWKGEHGPMVAQRETGATPVALLPTRRGYRCFDPATGRTERVDSNVAATLEAFAWQFYPPFPLEKIGVAGLLRFGLRGARSELSLILLAGAGVAVAAMALPAAMGFAFDTLIPGARAGVLSLLALLLLVSAVCGSSFELLRGFVLLRIEGKMDASLQAAVWDRLLELPPAFFRRFSAGDLTQRGLGIQAMREVLTGSVVTSLLTALFSLSSFGLLVFYDAKLSLYAAGLTALAFGLVALSGFLQSRHQRKIAAVRGKLSGLLLQLIGGSVKIRVSAAEPRAFAAWATLFSRLKTSAVRSRASANRVTIFNSFYPVACSAILFYAYSDILTSATPDPAHPPMSTGDFVAFLTAFTQMMTAALGFAAAFNSVVAVAPAYERARPILEAVPETAGDRSQPGELQGHIEVRHVSFSYGPDSPPILKDVSLTIEPGMFAAIVGPSGSGKSTLLRMLLAFEMPDSGAIYFDRQDIANLDARAVRRQIGVVLQNGRIRAGSILDNIIGTARLTVDDAWEAARMAGFDADVEAMPMGMQTVLGEGGGTLSGGQRQRLLIARALVRRPRIVFFDEATSALDNQTQAIVSRSLDNLRATRVVIAHRLSTIERADRIYVMERGRLVEEGNYAELMARGGRFAELARRQIA